MVETSNSKIKINIKQNFPRLNSSRSRSRLPHKSSESPSSSASQNRDQESQNYRDRSNERSSEKVLKSDLYKKDNPSLQDFPLLNSSFNNKIKLPQHKQEQDDRGRQRERDGNDDVSMDSPVESEDNDMISLMGFGGFGTTKGQHVKGAKGGTAKTESKSEYRKYMNRSKGFNRPLSPTR